MSFPFKYHIICCGCGHTSMFPCDKINNWYPEQPLPCTVDSYACMYSCTTILDYSDLRLFLPDCLSSHDISSIMTHVWRPQDVHTLAPKTHWLDGWCTIILYLLATDGHMTLITTIFILYQKIFLSNAKLAKFMTFLKVYNNTRHRFLSLANYITMPKWWLLISSHWLTLFFRFRLALHSG